MTANLQASSSDPLTLLHYDILRWVNSKGWTSLRPLQVQSIPEILPADRDVILSAATAGGKTEAAFLPILSNLLHHPPSPGVSVLCISPLKALINDQFLRLTDINRFSNIEVTPWHGDISSSKKARLVHDPQGVLIITPESLEAMFIKRGLGLKTLIAPLRYIVIDELHAFFGAERGCQLLSLLNRVDHLLQRKPPRIALSATLADMQQATRFLRREASGDVRVICAGGGDEEIKMQVRGYEVTEPGNQQNPLEGSGTPEICHHLFSTLRGSKNLIFANQRSMVELISNRLKVESENARVPNEFYPHHGSLNRELRHDAEQAATNLSRPASIVCTSTLELGIDIGDVNSVAQIGSPPSAASLKQRVGRSGRTTGIQILRVYVQEEQLNQRSGLIDGLRLQLVQSIAIIELLLQKRYEPPVEGALHFSTLIQQLLSVIAQFGSVRVDQAYGLLCKTGPFHLITPDVFKMFLRAIADKEIVQQIHDGSLVLGAMGDRLVNHYSFYAAFQTQQEYRICAGSKVLGSIPMIMPAVIDMPIIFGGRTWKITDVDEQGKSIFVVPFPSGKPPMFGGHGPLVHDMVRQEMMQILACQDRYPYLDRKAQAFLEEARSTFAQHNLHQTKMTQVDGQLYIIPWVGDRILVTLQVQLLARGIPAEHYGPVLYIAKEYAPMVAKAMSDIVLKGPADATILAASAKNLLTEKFDEYLTEELLQMAYGRKMFEPQNAWLTASELAQCLQ